VKSEGIWKGSVEKEDVNRSQSALNSQLRVIYAAL
jgi:hypothetical protein